VFVTASIGIAIYPSDGETADVLIQHADLAMYRAKQNGKARYEVYRVAAALDRRASSAESAR
jgi:diguanylate cyclase (GGDEF)-like protein